MAQASAGLAAFLHPLAFKRRPNAGLTLSHHCDIVEGGGDEGANLFLRSDRLTCGYLPNLSESSSGIKWLDDSKQLLNSVLHALTGNDGASRSK